MVDVRRDTVNFVIGSHDAANMGFLHGSLKGNQKVFSNNALRVISRCRIRSALRLAVHGEMLHRRHNMMAVDIEQISLKACDGCHRYPGNQVWIFSVGFFGAAPARIAREIKHRRKHLARTGRSLVMAACIARMSPS